MKKRVIALAIQAGIFAVLAFCIVPHLHAASFDCTKAEIKVEKMICAHPKLSRMDEELSALYLTALQDKTQADLIRKEQKQWLKDRNHCADVACVKIVYDKRISYLSIKQITPNSGVAEEPREVSSTKGGSWTYKYGEGEDEPLCQELLRRLNGYDWNESQPTDCSWNVIASYPEFTEPPWEELDSRKYEDLIVKLKKYLQEGPDSFFHKTPGLKEMAPKEYYLRKAKYFIEHDGRLQVWQTKLSAFNPTNPKRRKNLMDEQTLIRMSGGFPMRPPSKEFEEKRTRRCKGLSKLDFKGSIVYVTSDLSGPDPDVEEGTWGVVSGHDLKLYHGKPIFVGFETIWQDSPVGLIGYCNFEFVKGEN